MSNNKYCLYDWVSAQMSEQFELTEEQFKEFSSLDVTKVFPKARYIDVWYEPNTLIPAEEVISKLLDEKAKINKKKEKAKKTRLLKMKELLKKEGML